MSGMDSFSCHGLLVEPVMGWLLSSTIALAFQAGQIVGQRFCGWVDVSTPLLLALPGIGDGQFRLHILDY